MNFTQSSIHPELKIGFVYITSHIFLTLKTQNNTIRKLFHRDFRRYYNNDKQARNAEVSRGRPNKKNGSGQSQSFKNNNK